MQLIPEGSMPIFKFTYSQDHQEISYQSILESVPLDQNLTYRYLNWRANNLLNKKKVYKTPLIRGAIMQIKIFNMIY